MSTEISPTDILKEKAKLYQEFDGEYCKDPFKKIHWGTMQKWIETPCEIIGDGVNFSAVFQPIKQSRTVSDFTRVSMVTQEKGDHKCHMFACKPGYESQLISALLDYCEGKNVWFARVNQENPKNAPIISALGAKFISCTITGVCAEIYGIYYRGLGNPDTLPDYEVNCFELMGTFEPGDVVAKLDAANLVFEANERGSAYGGPDKTWRRILIRNAYDDRSEAKDQILNHPAVIAVPEIAQIIFSRFKPENLGSIMITRTRAGDGIIARHTDFSLDKKLIRGFSVGSTRRMHFVLQGNPKCDFQIWGVDGRRQSVTMKTGEVWYTDIRKPHAVDNLGTTDRIHIVLDIFN